MLMFNKKRKKRREKQKKNEVEKMRSCFEDLDWFEDLVDFVDIGGFGFKLDDCDFLEIFTLHLFYIQ